MKFRVKGNDGMDIQLIQQMTDYMAVTADARKLATSKIASLEKENATLRAKAVSVDAVKNLVSKLASAGVVDATHEAYFTRNVSDGNVSVVVEKLINSLGSKQASTINKDAVATSPYRVVKPGTQIVNSSQAEQELSRRLARLSGN